MSTLRQSTASPWMQVGPRGKAFHLLDQASWVFDLEDVVPALSRLCRFNGHCNAFYSVAQHSVLVSQLCPAAYALDGLLHDAAEAYTGDIIQPWKMVERADGAGDSYATSIRREIEDACAKQFGVDPKHPLVKHADLRALATEKRDLLPQCVEAWSWLPDPHSGTIIPLSPAAAEQLFWQRWEELRK